MAGLKSSPYGRRLRKSCENSRELSVAVQPACSESIGLMSDRFMPFVDLREVRVAYHVRKSVTVPFTHVGSLMSAESDAVREQANGLHSTVLHAEMNYMEASRFSDKETVSPTRERLLRPMPVDARASEPSDTRLDSTSNAAYSLSPTCTRSTTLLGSPRRQLRIVGKTPYRVLDAPDLADDFYLNLVDWSPTNVLGVGLGACVYLWTAHTASVAKLCDLSSYHDTVSSVEWSPNGAAIAVGTLSGRIHIYDTSTSQLSRSYPRAHSLRIGTLAWQSQILSSGSRDRSVLHRDTRDSSTRPFRRSSGHKQEVCGLKWNSDQFTTSNILASGGNDNKICIWDFRSSMRNRSSKSSTPEGHSQGCVEDEPLWKFHEHSAAVKALAWDPHVAGVLATGGGTQDKHVRFWNIGHGCMISALDTGSQVCNLMWSRTSHEFVSTHGFSSTTSQNQICVWKYPSLSMVASLSGHTHRVLYLAMSPDGETIVTGAGDETLRFWNVFPRRSAGGTMSTSKLDIAQLIR